MVNLMTPSTGCLLPAHPCASHPVSHVMFKYALRPFRLERGGRMKLRYLNVCLSKQTLREVVDTTQGQLPVHLPYRPRSPFARVPMHPPALADLSIRHSSFAPTGLMYRGLRTSAPLLYRFVHRQDPATYQKDLAKKGLVTVHAPVSKALAFGPRATDRWTWSSVAGTHPAWPPPSPGSTREESAYLTSYAPRVVSYLVQSGTCVHHKRARRPSHRTSFE
jgi:hypothetical protein